MHDQKELWDKLHQRGGVDHYTDQPTEFAVEVLQHLSLVSKILELGCGVGNDSIAFAKAGYTVVATDFSDIAVAKNTERFHDVPGLSFRTLDINSLSEFSDEEFDVVYARLSLHYFGDAGTKNIFKEIHRILKLQGTLAFMCKSTNDPLYGKGIEIEKDVFELDGHVRHFFSKEYVRECLGQDYRIEISKEGNEQFYGEESSFIEVIAKSC